MLVKDFIDKIYNRINDPQKIGYSLDEIKGYLNDGITHISAQLIALEDGSMVVEQTLTGDMPVPNGYSKPVGKYPICRVGDTLHLYDTPPVIFQYYAFKPGIKDDNENIPFEDIYIPALLQVVTIYALNRNNDLDTTQNERILAALTGAIQGAKG